MAHCNVVLTLVVHALPAIRYVSYVSYVDVQAKEKLKALDQEIYNLYNQQPIRGVVKVRVLPGS